MWVIYPLPHPLNFLLISWWGLKLNFIWRSTHVAEALQIGKSHSLATLRMWWDWFIHTARCNLQSCAQTLSLTALWPKIFYFADFMSQSTAVKFSPMIFQVHYRSKAWLETWPRKFIRKNLFLSKIWQNCVIFMKILGCTVYIHWRYTLS